MSDNGTRAGELPPLARRTNGLSPEAPEPGQLILVTGGAGYIGSVLTQRLLDRGYRVRILDRLYWGRGPIGSFLDRIELVEADVRARDLAATLAWPGTPRMMRRFWRTGVQEVAHAVSRRALARTAARYVPELTAGDLEPGWAGVRAQALGRDGKLVDDFVISHTGRALHVRNAPSPAATSSLAIAALIADRAQEALGLRAAGGSAR